MIDGVECSETMKITQEVFKFYSNLYKSSYTEKATSSFFERVKNLIPVIDGNFKEICDEELRISEFDIAIRNMASDRAPGPDGLTANFYKRFWEDLKHLLFQAVEECVSRNELMEYETRHN